MYYLVLIHVFQEQQRRWDHAPCLLLLLPCDHCIPLTLGYLYFCLIFCYFDFRHADQVCFSTIFQFRCHYYSVYFYLCWPSFMLFISLLSRFTKPKKNLTGKPVSLKGVFSKMVPALTFGLTGQQTFRAPVRYPWASGHIVELVTHSGV